VITINFHVFHQHRLNKLDTHYVVCWLVTQGGSSSLSLNHSLSPMALTHTNTRHLAARVSAILIKMAALWALGVPRNCSNAPWACTYPIVVSRRTTRFYSFPRQSSEAHPRTFAHATSTPERTMLCKSFKRLFMHSLAGEKTYGYTGNCEIGNFACWKISSYKDNVIL
jgi:hypothetical protein